MDFKELIKKIGSKNLIMIGIGFMVLIFFIIGGSLLYYNFFYKKSFSEIEDIMLTSARQYYDKNPNLLPQNNGEDSEVQVSTLVNKEYMKDIASYVKDEDIACKASVKVTKANKTYRYTPLLDCGKYYNYKFFSNVVKSREKVVTEGAGLYDNAGELVYRGEKVHNYVKFAGYNWRIIKIVNDNVMLIYNNKDDIADARWDDRYNKERQDNSGINDYTVSRIRDYLNSLYNNEKFFSNTNKELLTNFDLYIGKVGETEDARNREIERSSVLANQYIGLVTIGDFMTASLDNDCITATSPSCSNYNYIANYDYTFHSITGSKEESYSVYEIDENMGAFTSLTSDLGSVRPVISISKNALYVSGNGTKKNPYTFR